MSNKSEATKLRSAAVAAFLAIAMLVTACSSSTGSSTSGPSSASGGQVQEATTTLDKLVAPLTFTAPGPQVDVGTKLQGKTIYFVSAALGYEFTQLVLSGMKDAASKAGLKIVALDAKGDTTTATRQIEQAIGQRAAGIAIMNFPANALAAPLREAKAAGIPVFDVFDGDPGLPTPEEAAVGVVAKATFCYSCVGKQLAAMAVVQGKGNVNAALITVPDVSAAVLEANGFKSELARLCASCKVKEFAAPTAQWGTLLPSLATAAAQDPKVNFIVPMFAALQDLMKPSLLAAGAQGRISVITYNAIKTSMQDLQTKQFTTGIIASPEIWMGWGIMDQVFRVLTGGQGVATENVANRAFTAANAADANPNAGANYGDVDFKAEYSKLWGFNG
jgi:ribose transport system substrate-binding protein